MEKYTKINIVQLLVYIIFLIFIGRVVYVSMINPIEPKYYIISKGDSNEGMAVETRVKNGTGVVKVSYVINKDKIDENLIEETYKYKNNVLYFFSKEYFLYNEAKNDSLDKKVKISFRKNSYPIKDHKINRNLVIRKVKLQPIIIYFVQEFTNNNQELDFLNEDIRSREDSIGFILSGENIVAQDYTNISHKKTISVPINSKGMVQTITDLRDKFYDDDPNDPELSLPLVNSFLHNDPEKLAEQLGFYNSQTGKSPIIFKNGTLEVGDLGIAYNYPDGRQLILMRPDGILDETYTELLGEQLYKTSCNNKLLVVKNINLDSNEFKAGQKDIDIFKFKVVACENVSTEFIDIITDPSNSINYLNDARLYLDNKIISSMKESTYIPEITYNPINFAIESGPLFIAKGQEKIFTVRVNIKNYASGEFKIGLSSISTNLGAGYMPNAIYSKTIKIIPILNLK